MKAFVAAILLLAIFAAPRSENGSIEGRIIGRVIPGVFGEVKVVLYGPAEGRSNSMVSTTIDASGRYLFNDIQPGHYRIIVFRDRQETNGPDDEITLDTGQHLKDVDFRLYDPAVIQGKVLDSRGRPVSHANVSLIQITSAYSDRFESGPAVPAFSRSDSRGNFQIDNVHAGEYLVAAEYDWFEPSPPKANEQYYRSYFPGTMDEEKASTVRIEESSRKSIDLIMQSGPTRTISGNVVIPQTAIKAGVPDRDVVSFLLVPSKAGRTVRPLSRQVIRKPMFPPVQRSDFELKGIPPGSYELFPFLISEQGLKGLVYSVRVPVDVTGKDVRNLKVVIQRGVDATGRIVFVADKGAAIISPEVLKLNLIPMDTPSGVRPVSIVSVLPDGTFVIPNLMDGSYSVRIGNLPPDAFVSDFRGDRASYPQASFTVAKSLADAPLELSIHSPGARIEGTVVKTDSMEWVDITVVLVPEGTLRQNPWLMKIARPDSSGQFQIRGIAPGKYKAFVWDGIVPYHNPEFIHKFEDFGADVDVQSGGHLTLKLGVIPSNTGR
jgi:protocatechuate 3,4-dioxygenase beta subunit